MTTRDRVLDAGAHLMSTIGLARATTREIAREAGCSEGMLYKLFRSKEELFLAVLSERAPGLVPVLRELPDRVGRGTVGANLREVVTAAIGFYQHSFPIAASLFAEPQLLDAHRAFLRRSGAGPHLATELLAGYLGAEQRGGRLPADRDPEAVALLILGGCLNYAFLGHFTDHLPWPDPRRCAAAIMATVEPLL